MKTLQQLLMKKETKRKYQNDEKSKRDIERSKIIEDGKRTGIDELIKENEIINNNLKSHV